MTMRHRSLVLSVVAVAAGLVFAARGRAALDLDGAVAIWLLDEADGDRVVDATGNANSGLFVNDVQRVKGKFGGALEFDGDTAYVQMNSPVVKESEDFSMGCWTKPADTQKWHTNMLSSHQEPPQRGMSSEQDALNANVYYLIAGNGAAWMGWVIGNLKTELEADTWQHFVAVREGDSLTYYLDGEVAGQSKVGMEALKAAATSFRLANWVFGAREWAGSLDEVFIFSRALSQDEVQAAMSGGLAGHLDVWPEGMVATKWATLKGTTTETRCGHRVLAAALTGRCPTRWPWGAGACALNDALLAGPLADSARVWTRQRSGGPCLLSPRHPSPRPEPLVASPRTSRSPCAPRC